MGHPLVDRFPVPPDKPAARQALGIAPEDAVITLLPASRQQELKYLMPPPDASCPTTAGAEPGAKNFTAGLRQPVSGGLRNRPQAVAGCGDE